MLISHSLTHSHSHSFSLPLSLPATYLGAKFVQGKGLKSINVEGRVGVDDGKTPREEELLGALSTDNLYDTRAKLLNGGDVVGENTHVTRGGGNVDLLDVDILKDGLVGQGQSELEGTSGTGGLGSVSTGYERDQREEKEEEK